MNRPAQSFPAGPSAAPGGFARILFLTSLVAVGVTCCSAQDEVHITPRMTQSTESGPGRSKENYSSEKEMQSVKAKVDLVLVPVIVMDQYDRPVLGLDKNNFSVYDGHDREAISHVSMEDGPISIGILFDTSDSMYGKLESAREAVLQFLRSASSEDEFFLVLFNTRPEIATDFTRSVDDIEEEISTVKPEGTTALLDAIYLAVSAMKHAHNQRKVLLILSDGGDNHSRYTSRHVSSLLAESNVQMYALGIFDEVPRTPAERVGPDLLAAMTNITGGRTLPIRNLNRIGPAVSQLSVELHNQYLIAYRPTNLAHDGKWHKIRVKVTPPRNGCRLHVYAKEGYYAPGG